MEALDNSIYGLGISFYDQIAAGLTGSREAAPGFLTDAAEVVDGGVVVTEIWDNGQDHRAFFEFAVMPNIPEGGTVRDAGDRTGQHHRRVRRPPCARRQRHDERHE